MGLKASDTQGKGMGLKASDTQGKVMGLKASDKPRKASASRTGRGVGGTGKYRPEHSQYSAVQGVTHGGTIRLVVVLRGGAVGRVLTEAGLQGRS